MAETAIRFSRIAKHFGGRRALEDVTLEVAAGDFFALVGVNGAGKTTLVKCMLDLCAVDRGTIDIFGTPHHLTAARKRLVFLPERFSAPYYLSGTEFIRYVLDLQGAPYDHAGAERLLGELDFDCAALARPVHSYSKGMTQKLGLAACFLSRKDLYVFDEPTSGLDPKARALFKGQLRALKRELRTMFFTSHSLADVAEICDRMAVVHDGVLRFAGTPEDLCRQSQAPDLEQAFLACIAGDCAPLSTAPC
jgi:ABC-2 type transport system ATP-binding protein